MGDTAEPTCKRCGKPWSQCPGHLHPVPPLPGGRN